MKKFYPHLFSGSMDKNRYFWYPLKKMREAVKNSVSMGKNLC